MTSQLTTAELRAVCQPPALLERESAEHWAGRLYMRRVSIHATRGFLRLGVSANTVTSIMVIAGVAAGASLLIGGLPGAILAALFVQLHLLLDCSDGEVARWLRTQGIRGVYLDRVGHYLTDAGLLIGLGFRAGDLQAGGWATLGALAAVAVLLVKAETDLVDAARAHAGLAAATDAAREPVSSRLAATRRVVAALRFHRLVGAVEASLLIVAAAVVDVVRGDLTATRIALIALAVVASMQMVLHLASILSSRRLS